MKHSLDWSDYADAGTGDAYADIPKQGGDFAKAVAVCISSGQCETLGRGLMCPSFRATGHPDHSPGGRVRLLKRALNDPSPARLLRDPALAEAMALCVSCKGCKRECENGVDMARIKIEYLAQQHEVTGPRLRSRLFAHLPRWLARHSWLRHLITWRNRTPWLAHLGERFFAINRRPLPQPASRALQLAPPAPTDANARRVVLFIDTFTRHFEPEIAEAAAEVLAATGYTVIPATPSREGDESSRPLCCGRSYLAHGMVDEARREAARTVAALLPHATAGVPIIALEPSCLLTLRDDYRTLRLGEAVEPIAGNIWLFEEFIARESQAGRMRLNLRPASSAQPFLIHGHCHQKATGAMKSMRKVLKQLAGAQTEFIEASCCGGAGSFGYEAEHAEVSQRMAEAALLPALHARPDAPIIANGFSCRRQIQDLAHRPTYHLAQLLRDHLARANAPER